MDRPGQGLNVIIKICEDAPGKHKEARMKLILGNKNYSSWSLRPWLLMSHFGLEFEEVVVQLYRENSSLELKKYSDAGKVPVLQDKGLIIWDSLAICEYVNETYLDDSAWPRDRQARAEARACSARCTQAFLLCASLCQ